jgi:signal transduction histidine kinase/DNA-binding response OmpR family regulator
LSETGRFTDWLAVGGDMAERIRAFDWSSTPIGPLETWSPALRMMVRFLLANRFPLLLWWGPQYVSIYNDAYRPILGTKHPWGLGQPLKECWREIWHVLQPLVDTPFKGGPATWNDDILLEINRHGFSEETHFTIAYSPVPDETAATGIGGVLATVHEITEKVVAERRVSALRDLAAATSETKTPQEACTIAAETLVRYSRDIPFALLYLSTPDGRQALLAASAGVDCDDQFSPAVIEFDAEAAPGYWSLREAAATKSIQVIDDLGARFGTAVPRGPWADPPRQALILPIRTSVASQVAGFLVAGVSARLKLDDAYRGFYELIANQIGIAVANARAYEEERKRAEALAEIDRAKTAFFSNVSHEFRTPLTLMLGPLEDMLGKSDALPSVDRERLETAQRNALRLLSLVNTLLDFSRIEAGRVEASYEATDLAGLTAELASVFRSTIERAGIRFLVDCPALAQPVYVDREMWEKIVLNLVSNAFKFTLTGQIEVALRQADTSAVLIVSDSGTGIPAEEIPNLFERFHRVKGARGRSYEGSGIGLALVQELVKLHGGTVRAESQVDRGSRFIVSLPLGTSHLPQDRIAAPRNLASTGLRAGAVVDEMSQWLPKEDRTEKPARTHSAFLSHDIPVADSAKAPDSLVEHVLLADDNADMRQYLERLLTQNGYDVTVVADGIAALEAARERKPDLVVTDVMMPRLDGFGLLREFRADPKLATVPIIVLSARAGEEARIEGMQAGATDYLVKPFSARELVARVQASLGLARVRQEAHSAIRKSEERLRAIVRATSNVIYRMNPDWTKMLELEGRGFIADTGSPSNSWLDTYIHPDDRPHVTAAIRQAIARKTMFELEHRVRRLDGTMGWTLSRAVPLLDANGEMVEWFGTATDVTERVKAESTRQLLLGELNHRVKNTLASVQAIAQQTLRHNKQPAEFAARFSGRIQSLSRVHSLLTDTTWRGADLREVIRDQLIQGSVDEMKIAASGPAVHLEPQTAVLLALMLHELGTNSTKYGALSSGNGRVAITWSAVDDFLHLQWVERGGPTVARPTRRGFGTVLIEQSVKSGGGTAEMLCEQDGITWKLSVRLPDAEPQSAEPALLKADRSKPDQPQLANGTAQSRALLAGLRFLVVEDEPLIALELVATLEAAGAEAASSVGTEAEALQVIEYGDFDCVLLDANLQGRSVNEIAAKLTRQRMPFIFITGYGRDSLPLSFRQAPALDKPVGEQQLIEAISTLVSATESVAQLKS